VKSGCDQADTMTMALRRWRLTVPSAAPESDVIVREPRDVRFTSQSPSVVGISILSIFKTTGLKMPVAKKLAASSPSWGCGVALGVRVMAGVGAGGLDGSLDGSIPKGQAGNLSCTQNQAALINDLNPN
jgi:hypothetical protein